MDILYSTERRVTGRMATTTGEVIEIQSEEEYLRVLSEADSSDSLVVVDCYADWCPPCRAIAPVYKELAKEYSHVVFVKVNVEKVPTIKKHLTVWALPTFTFVKKQKIVSSFMGANVNKLQYGLQNDGSTGVCGAIPCTIQ